MTDPGWQNVSIDPAACDPTAASFWLPFALGAGLAYVSVALVTWWWKRRKKP